MKRSKFKNHNTFINAWKRRPTEVVIYFGSGSSMTFEKATSIKVLERDNGSEFIVIWGADHNRAYVDIDEINFIEKSVYALSWNYGIFLKT